MIKKVILALSLAIAVSVSCFAEEITFELKLEKENIYPGKQTQLEAIFYNAADIPPPEIPFASGLDIKFLQTLKKSLPSKPGANSLVHIYRIVALKAGSFKIGPVIFGYGLDTYRSNSVSLVVEKETAPAGGGDSSARGEIDISKHIYLTLDAPKTTVFVNEKILLTLRLYSDWLDLENITFWQEPRENMITKKFGERTVSTIEREGTKYIVLEYKSSMFAATPGEYALEPIEVKLDVARPRTKNGAGPLGLLNDNRAVYDNFIGTGDRRTLRLKTQPFTVTVRPLTLKGQPESFKGAVGNFSLEVSVAPTKVKLGDTTALKMVISGDGNYDTVSMPQLKEANGIKVYDPQVITGRDSVKYELLVRVLSKEIRQIPEIVFAYFDPNGERYLSVQRGPLPIVIEGAPPETKLEKAAGAVKEEEKRQMTIVGLKDYSGGLRRYNTNFYRNKILILIWVLPVLMIIFATIIEKRMQVLRDNPRYAAMLSASRKARRLIAKAETFLKQGDCKTFYEIVFKTIQGYLGERVLTPTAGITEQVINDLRDFGIEEGMLNRIRKIFSDSYLVRYTSVNFSQDDMRGMLEEVRDVIKDLDKKSFGK